MDYVQVVCFTNNDKFVQIVYNMDFVLVSCVNYVCITNNAKLIKTVSGMADVISN